MALSDGSEVRIDECRRRYGGETLLVGARTFWATLSDWPLFEFHHCRIEEGDHLAPSTLSIMSSA
ncbi:hypothetical protein Scep_004411 [Stephania cephalantha]|uniref:Uncharacterized protein n=1 Tax=Stephania cephalantha TaxID=152367 RepID=A0AAP0PVC6_9MAGN